MNLKHSIWYRWLGLETAYDSLILWHKARRCLHCGGSAHDSYADGAAYANRSIK